MVLASASDWLVPLIVRGTLAMAAVFAGFYVVFRLAYVNTGWWSTPIKVLYWGSCLAILVWRAVAIYQTGQFEVTDACLFLGVMFALAQPGRVGPAPTGSLGTWRRHADAVERERAQRWAGVEARKHRHDDDDRPTGMF